MTLRLLGTPHLSLLELTTLSNKIGFPFEFLVKSPSASQVRYHTPERVLLFSPIRLVYVDSIDGLLSLSNHYKNFDVLFFVRVSLTELSDYNIETMSDLTQINSLHLRALLKDFYKLPETSKLEPTRSASAELVRDKSRESLLAKLQTAFYRIRDKDERSRVQEIAYKFLAVKTKTPSTGIEYIDRILMSPVATRFKSAMQEVKSLDDLDHVSEQHSIDRFELAYIAYRNRK